MAGKSNDGLLAWLPEVLVVVVALHGIWSAPYTKVEESFNMQAMHDLLYHRTELSQYDHHSFPGVVPRTFLGASLVAALSAPGVFAVSIAGLPRVCAQYIVRSVLALLVVGCLFRFKRAVGRILGADTGIALLCITSSQFHYLFYSSRSLPNTFAAALVLLAFADLLEGRHPRALVWLTIATAWFRCDMLLLCGTVGIMLLAARKMSFLHIAGVGLGVAAIAAVVTVAVDSVFWRRLLWPEGVVFWYNTIMNQSPNWGTSPWHWYATSALPRSMLGAALLAPVGLLSRVNPVLGCLDRRVAHVVLPALGFVAIYSWLPHKELRFVLPVVPLLNLAAAHGAVKLCPLKIKWKLPALAVLGLLAASACLSRVFLAAAAANYPGGDALQQLHTYHDSQGGAVDAPVSVHIDASAAMTGITRFQQRGHPWSYSKDESLKTAQDFESFDYCLTSEPERLGAAFTEVAAATEFRRLDIRRLRLVTEPWIHVMKRV